MRVGLALGVLLCAGPAFALSCIRPDVATTYERAAEAREIYVVVQGRLTFDQARVLENDLTGAARPDIEIPARLVGTSLSKDGFKTSFQRDISVILQCFGPWCGGAESGADYLAFLQRTDKGYALALDPCGSFAFPNPSEAWHTLHSQSLLLHNCQV